MKRWWIDGVIVSVLLFMFLRTAVPGEIPSCGMWWRREQGTFSCGDHSVSSSALARFSDLQVLLLDHVTLIKSPTFSTVLSEGLVSARADSGRELSTVEYLGVQTTIVPEWLMQRLPNLKTLTLRDAYLDFGWLKYTPRLKRLSVAGMTVPSTLPLDELPELEEIDLIVVSNASDIERNVRTARPDITVRVVRD